MRTDAPIGTLEQPIAEQRFSVRRILFYLISLAVLALIYFKFAEVKQLKESFSDANLPFLILAIIMQGTTYVCMAWNYKLILKIKGLPISIKDLYPVMLVIKFLNQALPSAGISGQVFFIDYLKRKGMTLAEGLARAILEIITLYMAFGLLFVICGFLGIRLERMGHPEIGYFIYVFLVIATLCMIAFILFQRKGGDTWVHRLIRGLETSSKTGKRKAIAMFIAEMRDNISADTLRKHRVLVTLAVFAHLGVFLLDVLTLYVLAQALGTPISFSVAFVVFTFTQFAAMISFVPGALGVFEGGMTLLLIGFGMSPDIALTLTLLFRALLFWLPMPLGWMLYRHFERHRHSQLDMPSLVN